MAAILEAGVCLLAWKQRTGLGRFFTKKSWEERWIVISGTSVQYYCLGEEDGDPRGDLNLITDKVRVNVTSQESADAPTPYQVDIAATLAAAADKSVQWKFCFHTQDDLMQFLQVIHTILDEGGQIEMKRFDRFEHDFFAGDHIYRWEMIWCPPVIYPIQIHGIVLEAGRNCVVVADFGLTGYGRKEGDKFNYADDHNSRAVLAAWKKLRPNQDQRLNLLTLTDPMEIRKWTRANYEESFLKAHGGDKFQKISKFFSSLKRPKRQNDDDEAGSTPNSNTVSDDESVIRLEEIPPSPVDNGSETIQPTKETSGHPQQPELPKSDPIDIVLARANFLMEYGDEKLPPYHVFYSNSECIAVWCKTGRWSTLQTAVFLGSTSVGAAKSATVTTIGVAAAHALLAPVVAVGGLIWVGAPMVILQKSRVQWEKNTMLMTDLFWSWAPPSSFVSAIANWSGLVKTVEDESALPNEDDDEQTAATATCSVGSR